MLQIYLWPTNENMEFIISHLEQISSSIKEKNDDLDLIYYICYYLNYSSKIKKNIITNKIIRKIIV